MRRPTRRVHTGADAPVGWWAVLPPWARVSLLGLVASVLLAVGLGIYIPRQVHEHLLRSELVIDQQLLAGVLSTTGVDVPLSPVERQRLDVLVRSAVIGGDYVRVKLWSRDGEVVYSDEPSLIGRRFPVSDALRGAFANQRVQEETDLTAPENEFERSLANRLLEVYLPVEQEGKVVAVWEIYRSLDRLDSALADVRRVVWLSVGTGLGVLFVFLASSFGSLLRTAQLRRRDAERHAGELAALLEIAQVAASSLDEDALIAASLDAICQEGGFAGTALLGGDDQQRAALIAWTGDCASVHSDGAYPGRRRTPDGRTLGVTIDDDDRTLVLVACRPVEEDFSTDDELLLRAAGQELAVGRRNARLYGELAAAQAMQRELTTRLVDAHEDERTRIVGEIHDGIAQQIHGLLFRVRGHRAAKAHSTGDALAEVEEELDGLSRRLRGLLQDLHPSTLDHVGLIASVRAYVDRLHQDSGIEVDLCVEEVPEPASDVRLAAFRIIQEALQNVVKHAGVSSATVAIERGEGVLELHVTDHGCGFAATSGNGLGIWLMRERAHALGGTLTVRSDGDGTAVDVSIPVLDVR